MKSINEQVKDMIDEDNEFLNDSQSSGSTKAIGVVDPKDTHSPRKNSTSCVQDKVRACNNTHAEDTYSPQLNNRRFKK